MFARKASSLAIVALAGSVTMSAVDLLTNYISDIDPEGVPDSLSTFYPATRLALEQVCRPGQVLLGREDGNGFDETMNRARACADDRFAVLA